MRPIESIQRALGDYTYGIEVAVQLPPQVEESLPPSSLPPSTTVPERGTVTDTDAAKAAGLLLVAVVFLVVLLYLSNFVTSRLVVGRLTAVEFPVGIDGSAMYRLDDAGERRPLVVEGRDISSHPLGRGEGKASSIDAGAVKISARTPAFPGSRSLATVSYSGATLVVASRGTWKNGRVGRMSNVLSGEWVFYTDQSIPEIREETADDPVAGTFMMMIPYGSDASFVQAQLDERAEAIAEQIYVAAREVSVAQLEDRTADEGDSSTSEENLAYRASAPAQELRADSASDAEVADDDDGGIWDFEEEDDW